VRGDGNDTPGVASRIIDRSFRNGIPKMFAALVLRSLWGWRLFAIDSSGRIKKSLVLGRGKWSEINAVKSLSDFPERGHRQR